VITVSGGFAVVGVVCIHSMTQVIVADMIYLLKVKQRT